MKPKISAEQLLQIRLTIIYFLPDPAIRKHALGSPGLQCPATDMHPHQDILFVKQTIRKMRSVFSLTAGWVYFLWHGNSFLLEGLLYLFFLLKTPSRKGGGRVPDLYPGFFIGGLRELFHITCFAVCRLSLQKWPSFQPTFQSAIRASERFFLSFLPGNSHPVQENT